MTSNEVLTLNSEVSRYMNDNLSFIKEANGGEATAQDVLDYYIASAEAEDPNTASYMTLNDEQQAQFLHVAETILKDGFYPHA